MGTGIVDDSLGTLFDEKLKELESLLDHQYPVCSQSYHVYLVDLPPFFGSLVSETLVDHWHNLVQLLAGAC